MKKHVLTLTLLAVFLSAGLLVTGGSLGGGKKEEKQKETVTIDSIQEKYGPVTLKHKAHVDKYGLKCEDCHHRIKEGEKPTKGCKSCHDLKEKKGKKVILKNAYHKRCKGCHKEKAKEAKEGKKPPTKCKECHGEKKK